MKVPTRLVRFKNGGHQALINVADFDPALHEVPGAAKEKAEPVREVVSQPAPKKAPAKKTVRRTRR